MYLVYHWLREEGSVVGEGGGIKWRGLLRDECCWLVREGGREGGWKGRNHNC